MRYDTAPDVAPEPIHAFALWHALEEIEHCDVAFDAFQHLSGHNLKLRRKMYFESIRLLSGFISKYQKEIAIQIAKQVKTTWKNRVDVVSIAFGFKGFLSTNTVRVFDYLRADFHPKQYDNSHLIAN